MRKYRAALLAGGLIGLGALTSPAALAATALNLSGPNPAQSVGPQSTSNPCVIAGTQCQQPAGFGFNNFNQTATSIDAFSSSLFESLADNIEGQAYTVNQIITALGGATAFNINLDVNTTVAASETLRLFSVRIGGVQTYLFDPGAPGILDGANVATGINAQGNGFADWTLGTVDLAGLSLDTPVLFFAIMTGLVDGAESFFLTAASSPSQVPIPGALLLMAPVLAGGAGTAWWRRRRARHTNGVEVQAAN